MYCVRKARGSFPSCLVVLCHTSATYLNNTQTKRPGHFSWVRSVIFLKWPTKEHSLLWRRRCANNWTPTVLYGFANKGSLQINMFASLGACSQPTPLQP
jgi:hypothetical protein